MKLTRVLVTGSGHEFLKRDFRFCMHFFTQDTASDPLRILILERPHFLLIRLSIRDGSEDCETHVKEY